MTYGVLVLITPKYGQDVNQSIAEVDEQLQDMEDYTIEVKTGIEAIKIIKKVIKEFEN